MPAAIVVSNIAGVDQLPLGRFVFGRKRVQGMDIHPIEHLIPDLRIGTGIIPLRVLAVVNDHIAEQCAIPFDVPFLHRFPAETSFRRLIDLDVSSGEIPASMMKVYQ